MSVGVAPTKVLAKTANHLAKANKAMTKCVVVLDTKEKINEALQQTSVKNIWGIGHQYAIKLKEMHAVFSAFDLSKKTEEWAQKNLGGVTGVRLLKELKGEEAIPMKEDLVNKKMIATTRMFGRTVKNITEIKEAISTYTSKAAEKLRRQHCVANAISIFVVTKDQSHNSDFNRGITKSDYAKLPFATSATNELIKPAMQLVENLFEEGQLYKKAGVMLSDLVFDEQVQGNLFVPKKTNGKRLLMNMIDNVNFSMRDDVIKFATSGTTRNWKMRMELRSPRYTTRWDELMQVS